MGRGDFILSFQLFEGFHCTAARGGAAAGVCTLLTLLAALLGCGGGVSGLSAAPGPTEPACAWYGDARDGTLYYGIASFWSAYRAAGGDPRADLAEPDPQRIGRFDLRRARGLEPLELGPAATSGIWDVLAHPDGPVYFTSLFGLSGRVDPRGGAVMRFDEVGAGLSELALGPAGTLLASRYAGPVGGSVVVMDTDGRLLAEHPLPPPDHFTASAKSVAWDPLRREIWVNTDLHPETASDPPAYDVRVLSAEGQERLRFAQPEVQFMTFAADGTGFFAELEGRQLHLRVRPPERAAEGPLAGRRILLDDAFPPMLDFVQDLKPTAGGGVLVTRWSGRIHRVGPGGEVDHLALARPGDALYYTAVAAGDRVCATLCGGIDVVCSEPDH